MGGGGGGGGVEQHHIHDAEGSNVVKSIQLGLREKKILEVITKYFPDIS